MLPLSLLCDPGSGEMAQQELAPIAEDLGSHPSTYTVPSIILFPGDLAPSSGCHGHYMQVVNRHACRQNIHTHKIFYKMLKLPVPYFSYQSNEDNKSGNSRPGGTVL